MEWSESSVEGQHRFLARVYRFVTRNAGRSREAVGENNDSDRQALRKLHQTVRKITNDFDSRWHFNTSIASLMELVNELYGLESGLSGTVAAQICEKLVLMLAPFAPFTAQELWSDLGKDGEVFLQPWPDYDPELAQEELLEMPLQVNGKLRGHLRVAFGTAKEDLEKLALANEKVKVFTDGKQIIKIIVVSDKLINIVVR
jgi:leucyl-tRNA synthetase